MNKTDAARRGGRARAASLSPEARRKAGQDAYLAGAVRTVIRRVGDLSNEQQEDLLSALRRTN
jgi:hypothetical protein